MVNQLVSKLGSVHSLTKAKAKAETETVCPSTTSHSFSHTINKICLSFGKRLLKRPFILSNILLIKKKSKKLFFKKKHIKLHRNCWLKREWLKGNESVMQWKVISVIKITIFKIKIDSNTPIQAMVSQNTVNTIYWNVQCSWKTIAKWNITIN